MDTIEPEVAISVTIDIEDMNKMLEDIRLLQCLFAAGVDNWDGYDYAMELFNSEE